MKNLAGFTFPYPYPPKTHPISSIPIRIRPKPALFYTQILDAGHFRGVCFCALHGYAQNLAGFIFSHTDTPKTHPVSPSPIRVHPKPARFYTQTVGVGHFGAYAFAPLHGYMKNPPGSTFPHPDTSKTHPISPFPIGIHPKRTRFYTQTVGVGHFGAYAFAPLHGCMKNQPGSTFPHPDTSKTHPILPFPIGIRQKRIRFHPSQ